VYDLLNGITFSDLECLLTKISRALHYHALNISETVCDRHMITIDH